MGEVIKSLGGPTRPPFRTARAGLTQLIQDVRTGQTDFGHLLVYDVMARVAGCHWAAIDAAAVLR
jgi:hypothetical protein